MAETATATAPAADNAQQTTRPQKPDENAFQADLAKAEKEHKASMERLVQIPLPLAFGRPYANVAPERHQGQDRHRPP